ncbi:PPE family protein, partial [Mycobacterium sp. E787]|uniref:PPE family protein n=1 Tax=Mycobacterium sp. E787 TaxID=1834150 RepID=UPI000A407087
MNFLVLPPEVNSARIYLGAGPGPMLAAAAAWEGLAGELGSAASSFGSVTSGLVGAAWQGPAAVAMVGAAAPYQGWLSAAAAQAQGAAGQARAAAAAFEAAASATVHPAAVAANRSQFVSLVRSNLLGLNAPAIAAAEAQYEQMWAADVSAMVGYHGGASAVAAQLKPMAQTLSGPLGPVQAALANFNLGAGNSGSGNVGGGNTGNQNLGGGNIGSQNVGGGNIGSANVGNGNNGVGNIGGGNRGNQNLGSGNAGNNNTGFGNAGLGNMGSGNLGNTNVGNGNLGSGNVGIGNRGDSNMGVGNRGSNNVGIANTGNH